MHYVYFLWSKKLKKVYLGETTNVVHRLNYHNKGLQRYTSKGIPWELVGYKSFENRQEAMKEERRLKKCKNKKYYREYLMNHCKKPKG